MRIALLTNGLGFGGAERVVEALADDLRERGHAVLVLATTRGGPIAAGLRARGHRVEVLGVSGAWDLRLVQRLGSALRAFRPDVLHSHLAVADIAAAAVRSLGGAPACVSTVHNPGVEVAGLKRRLWQAALPRLDRVTAVSQAARAQLALPEVHLVRPSLVDLDAPGLAPAEARRQLGLSPQRPLVLAVGRLTPVKGLDVLAAAVPRLRTPNVTVAVIGDGPERRALSGRGLLLMGPHPRAAEMLAAADVLALPSRSEGFPQVPLHAMAARVPVVGTRVGGTPEVVLDGVTGRLVPPEDADGLADALDSILEDPHRGRMGEAGRDRLRQAQLTRRAMTEAFERHYFELMRA